MTSNKSIRHLLTWAVALVVFVFTALPAVAQKGDTPSSLLTYKSSRLTPTDGYMVAGDLWDTIKPMNPRKATGWRTIFGTTRCSTTSQSDPTDPTGTIRPASGRADTTSRTAGETAGG